jgi:tetratricopeptide (TPR) repeat protein
MLQSSNPHKIALEKYYTKAKNALLAREYPKASENYIHAFVISDKFLPRYQEKMKLGLASVYDEWADSIGEKGKLLGNIKALKLGVFLLKRAIKLDPAQKVYYDNKATRLRKEIVILDYKRKINNADNIITKQDKEILAFIKQAHVLEQKNKYILAQSKLREVLKLDMYHPKATAGLLRLYYKLYTAELNGELKKENINRPKNNDDLLLMNKLDKIIFVQFNVQDISIKSLFEKIVKKANSLDDELNLQCHFVGFDPINALPPVSFSANNKSVAYIIKLLCEQLELKREVKGKVIIFKRK